MLYLIKEPAVALMCTANTCIQMAGSAGKDYTGYNAAWEIAREGFIKINSIPRCTDELRFEDEKFITSTALCGDMIYDPCPISSEQKFH